MRGMLQILLAVSLAAISFFSATGAARACACGAFLLREGRANIPAETGLVRFDGGREDLIMSIHLATDAREAAWILPTPARPEVKAGDLRIFEYLREVTKPRVEQRERLDWFGLGTIFGSITGSVGVTLLERRDVGMYDVSVLAASNAAGLNEWLTDHGYRLPADVIPVLDYYVAQEWFFVAVRVSPDQAAKTLKGDIQPLWVSFPTNKIVYPMRMSALAASRLDVAIYIMADHRMTIEGLETEYAAVLEPSNIGASVKADHPILELVNRPFFLTKLRRPSLDPAQITDDFMAQAAPDDAPYQQVTYEDVYLQPTGLQYAQAIAFGAALFIGLPLLAILLFVRVARGIGRAQRRQN